MSKMLLSALLTLAAACGHHTTKAPMTTTNTPRDQLGIEWDLQVLPSTLSMAQRGEFRISVTATNRGTEAIDPQFVGCSEGSDPCVASAFTVNGQESFALEMAFGNGIRVAEWFALPPGATVDDARAMGESLFEAPGSYTIAFRHGDAYVEKTVTVTP